MAFQEGAVTSAYVGLEQREPDDEAERGLRRETIKKSFIQFIRLFRDENTTAYKYQEALRRNIHNENYFLEVWGGFL